MPKKKKSNGRKNPPREYILDKMSQPIWDELLGKARAERVTRKKYDEKPEKVEFVRIHVDPCKICGKYNCKIHKQRGSLEIW